MLGASRALWRFAAVPAVLCAPQAQAASAQLVLAGNVPAHCTISGAVGALSLGEASRGATGDVGNVAVTCNLVDVGPSITLSSANRGLKIDGGEQLIPYGLEWNLPGTTAFYAVTSTDGAVTAQLDAFAPGTAQSAHLIVKVSAAAASGKMAGTYRDVIVISISP